MKPMRAKLGVVAAIIAAMSLGGYVGYKLKVSRPYFQFQEAYAATNVLPEPAVRLYPPIETHLTQQLGVSLDEQKQYAAHMSNFLQKNPEFQKAMKVQETVVDVHGKETQVKNFVITLPSDKAREFLLEAARSSLSSETQGLVVANAKKIYDLDHNEIETMVRNEISEIIALKEAMINRASIVYLTYIASVDGSGQIVSQNIQLSSLFEGIRLPTNPGMMLGDWTVALPTDAATETARWEGDRAMIDPGKSSHLTF